MANDLDLHTTTWYDCHTEVNTCSFCRDECPHRLIDCSDINKEYYWQCEFLKWYEDSGQS